MSDLAGSFFLGWHRFDVMRAAKKLVYVLVPADIDGISGSIPLRRINSVGGLEQTLHATSAHLASPRLAEDTEGVPHPVETVLIQVLQERASRAGHAMPAIVPSRRFPGWSQMRLAPGERDILLRAGGLE